MNGRHHRTPLTDKLKSTVAELAQQPRMRLAAAAAATALLAALAVGSHQLGHLHADSGREHAAAAVVHYETPKACLDALDHADQAMDEAEKFGAGMADFHAGALDLLRRGDEGHAVKKLQAYLNAEADAGLKEDGDFGAKTEKAVKAYREAQGKHRQDSEDFLSSLADTREAYAAAAEQCRGGES